MGKFEDMYEEPSEFSDGTIVISRERYTDCEAAKIITKELAQDGELDYLCYEDGFAVKPEDLKPDTVAFRFHNFADECDSPCWVVGETGKGSKKIWSFG